MDGTGEIVPGADTLVGCVISAVLLGDDHIAKQVREVVGVGGRADLIAHDVEIGLGLGKTEHGLDKVVSVDAEYP